MGQDTQILLKKSTAPQHQKKLQSPGTSKSDQVAIDGHSGASATECIILDEFEKSSIRENSTITTAQFSKKQSQEADKEAPLINSDVSCSAGRLRLFVENWKSLTQDSIILSWVKGLRIPFSSVPFQYSPIYDRRDSPEEIKIIKELIQKLLDDGAITQCESEIDQILSPFFIIPKTDKSYRFILNLKNLNKFIKTEHFKLENHKTACNLLERNCFMCKIDLKDAYYLVAIDESHRKYLRFCFLDNVYEFTCLAFGLNITPFIFTKLLKPVMTWLRRLGYTSVIYLDDILLFGNTYKECRNNFLATWNILEFLGFIINKEKSVPIPSQTCVWLGFLFDSRNMVISLTEERKQKILALITKFSKLNKTKIREFAQFIGSIISCCAAIEYSWLYTKAFEREKILALETNNENYDAFLNLNSNLKPDFEWWKNNILIGKRDISCPPPLLEIFSDASLTGWGAVCQGKKANGFWTEAEQNDNINYLELKAAYFGLKCFAEEVKCCNILLRIDNSTAICYINRMGGTQFPHLNEISRKIWKFCEKRKIVVFASYIKSKDNVEADTESRKL